MKANGTQHSRLTPKISCTFLTQSMKSFYPKNRKCKLPNKIGKKDDLKVTVGS